MPSFPNQALRLLVRRADRQLSLTCGLPDSNTADGTMSAVRGELMMVRAALHCACVDLYVAKNCRNAAADKRSAEQFLAIVAPGLMADKARIEAHLAIEVAA